MEDIEIIKILSSVVGMLLFILMAVIVGYKSKVDSLKITIKSIIDEKDAERKEKDVEINGHRRKGAERQSRLEDAQKERDLYKKYTLQLINLFGVRSYILLGFCDSRSKKSLIKAIGISKSTINRIIKNERVSKKTEDKVCDYFGIENENFYGTLKD